MKNPIVNFFISFQTSVIRTGDLILSKSNKGNRASEGRYSLMCAEVDVEHELRLYVFFIEALF